MNLTSSSEEKFMKLKTLCYFLFFLLSCNNNDWILYRAGNDYFPLKKGNWWQYETNGIFEMVEVKGDTIVYDRPCVHLLRNFADEYWVKDNGDVKKLELRTVNYNGTDYLIQKAWLLQYRLPFVLGSFWSEAFADTVVVLGDTHRIKQTITRQVFEITDITVPAGTFLQTYKIEYTETFILNDSTEYYSGYEWFAPGVGLIKKISNNIEKILNDYSVK